LIFPYDDPTCFNGIVASACICGSTLAYIDATRTGDGGASASKKWNHRFTQMHTDDCIERGRQMLATTLMFAPMGSSPNKMTGDDTSVTLLAGAH
jgi:hypothetical protein